MTQDALNKDLSKETFDYVVVGGGSAGCVMAARLSEDGTRSVLLLEAGPASDVNTPGSPLRDASRLVLEGYNWMHQANLGPEDRYTAWHRDGKSPINTEQNDSSDRKQFGYRIGKVMGGSSAINGAVALRTFPSDFEQWAQMGCPSWSWNHVLPWFKKMETDVDRSDDPLHGDSGPMRLRRPTDEELHPLDAAFSEACQEQHGLAYAEDLNAGENPAVGLVPSNVGEKAERFCVYRSYLEPVLDRKNLHVVTDASVIRVEFNGKKATGVVAVKEGKEILYRAGHTVLCGGAIGTPAVLQRSGVGDAKHLNKIGIPVVADLPAVGKNLMDHASLVLWSLPKPGVCQHGLPWRQVAARVVSGYDEKVDVQIGLLNNIDSSTVPKFKNRVEYPMLVGASAMLMQPSARGRVFLDSSAPDRLPQIDLPLRSNESDILRLVGSVRQIWEVLTHPKVDHFLDGIQFWSESMIYNDVVMRSAIKNLVNPGWHPSGTVRMGRADDPETAAQENGNLHGLDNVTVADASLFPVIPSMPTNLTTIMLAERIANLLIEQGE